MFSLLVHDNDVMAIRSQYAKYRRENEIVAIDTFQN